MKKTSQEQTAQALCPLCKRTYLSDEPADTSCRRCSDESIDKALTPFLLIHRYLEAGDLERAETAKLTFRNRSESRHWKLLLNAARKKWPAFDSERDHTVIAVRIQEWLDVETRNWLQLQRELVPAETVASLLTGERTPNESPDGTQFESRDARIPNEFRTDQKEDGEPYGPITGFRYQLGKALHVNDNLMKDSYKDFIRDAEELGRVYLQPASGRKFEMFVKSERELTRCQARMGALR